MSEKESIEQMIPLLRSFGHRCIGSTLRALATEPLYQPLVPEKAREALIAAADEELKTANEIMDQARPSSGQPESREGE